jgi:hypothetical protein
MRLRNIATLGLVTVVVLVGFALTARTFINSGPAAIAQMDSAELAILAKTDRLHRGMSRNEVVTILGAPDEEGPLGLRPKWCVGSCLLNGLAVYIHPTGAAKVLWISLGRFVYEKVL